MHVVRVANKADLIHAARIYESGLRLADWLPDASRRSCDFASDTAGEDICVCLTKNHDIAGFISVWTPESFVHHLYVDQRFHRKGVGTSLLASLDSWLPKPWTLKCLTANDVAMEFYMSLGWVPVSMERGPDGDYHLMRFPGSADGNNATA